MSLNLTDHAQELVQCSGAYFDPMWDESAGLLRAIPSKAISFTGERHEIRGTCWYALGLLMRGDHARAARALEAVLLNQFNAPNTAFDGTWRRYKEEPDPPASPVEWRDYDPNWREFIGTSLVIILTHYENQLPPGVSGRIEAAIRRGCAGSYQRKTGADYTNIALMTAFLLVWSGRRFGITEWVRAGEKLGREIYDLFNQHESFNEYNSPTYYGVDLYALGLWRSYSLNEHLMEWSSKIEHALWRDIAQYYHAEMRNLAGPYDRSYGMDMRRYGAKAGLFIWLQVGRALAPFPDTTRLFDHSHDFASAPICAAVGVNMPPDAAPHFTAFRGPRQVERRIDNERTATAWIGEHLLLGGENTSGQNKAWAQFHPATVHWKYHDDIQWMRVETIGPIDVVVTGEVMTLTAPASPSPAPVAFNWRIYAPGATQEAIGNESWAFPGLRVGVSGNFVVSERSRSDGIIEVACSLSGYAAGEMTLRFKISPS